MRDLLLLLLVISCACIGYEDEKSEGETGIQPGEDSPEFYVAGTGVPADDQELENMKTDVLGALIPSPGVRYDAVNVTATGLGSGLNLEVTAVTRVSEYPDIYRFYYSPDEREITLKGYVLEAIPPAVRSEAIAVALASQEIEGMLETLNMNPAEPTVKRILPETSAKYYAPKTLFSVTWRDFDKKVAVSALVDLETGQVVQTWQGVE